MNALAATPRLEVDLVQGRGRFVDDVSFPGECHGAVVRSPHPHAEILAIDVARAASAPGALTVVTGEDLRGVVTPLPCAVPPSSVGGHVTVREGDSSTLITGSGTGGSTSLLTASVAVETALTDTIGRGRALTAKKWEIHADDVVFDNGRFTQVDGDRSLRLADLLSAFPGALDGEASATLRRGSSANGCHACEVEIDPETGRVDVVRYVAVDDFGQVVDEAAVRGQVQGGVAMGIGQALLEHAPTADQLTGGSRPYHYALPTAVGTPVVEWHDNGLPFRGNVHGAKACAESGTAAAPPMVMNAVADALSSAGTAGAPQMPATPFAVWTALQPS